MMPKTKGFLTVLGYYPEAFNILLELGKISQGFESFHVLENMEASTPEHYAPFDEYNVRFFPFFKDDYCLADYANCAFGVTGVKSKEAVFNYFKGKLGIDKHNLTNLVHPNAFVSPSAELDNGLQLGAFSMVNSLAEVGFGVNIKYNCHIGHHSRVGDYVTINPGVVLAGFSEIGSNTLIGSGTIIKDSIKIGSNCIIGQMSNVVSDLPDNSLAYGNPCKVIKLLD